LADHQNDRKVPRGGKRRSVVVGLGLVLLLVVAIAIGFPLIRSFLAAVHGAFVPAN
jgi:hypothetical protein